MTSRYIYFNFYDRWNLASTVSLNGIPLMCEPPLQPAASTVARQVPLSGSPSTWSRFTAAIRVLRRRSMESLRSHQRSFTSFLIPTNSSHTGIWLRICMIIASEESLSYVISVLINKLQRSCHGWGGYSSAFHRGGLGWDLGQSMWNLWWKKVVLWQVFLRVMRFYRVTAIPARQHIHIFSSLTPCDVSNWQIC